MKLWTATLAKITKSKAAGTKINVFVFLVMRE
jgi:hypothetical protein